MIAVFKGIFGVLICLMLGATSSVQLDSSLQKRRYKIDFRDQKSVVWIVLLTLVQIIIFSCMGYLEWLTLDWEIFKQHNSSENFLEHLLINLTIGTIIEVAFILYVSSIGGEEIKNMQGWLFPMKEVNLCPNQGIWNSLKTSLITAICLFSTLTLLSVRQDESRLFFVPATLLFGLMLGGMACVKHFSMRLVLCAIAKVIPWDYARFLDYCVERRLLQRIGGRYHFLHRELLEHFADKAGGIS